MKPLRILCIDRNAGEVSAFGASLADAGLAVTVVAACDEAAARRHVTESWDAILFEWENPIMPPYTWRALLRDTHPHMPAAVLTKLDSARALHAARAFGFGDYFLKGEERRCAAWLRGATSPPANTEPGETSVNYRDLFESAYDAILHIVGVDARIANANLAAIRLLGYSLEELRGMSALDLVPDGKLAEAEASFQNQMTRDEPFLVETVWRAKNGSLIPVSASGTWMSAATEPSFFLVARSMVAQRSAAEALKRVDERLKEAQRAAHVGSWESDFSGNSIWSEEMYRIVGWDVKKPPPSLLEFLPLVHPDDRDEISRRMMDSMRREEPFNIDYRIMTPDGNVKYVNAIGKPQRSAPRQPRYVGTLMDISSRKLSELRARNLNARLTQHMANSPLAYIEWDNEWRVVEWSNRAMEMFGWTKAEVLGQRWGEWRLVHEDDLDLVKEVTADLSAAANVQGVTLNRNYRKDGSVIHCEWYNSVLFDDRGRVVSVLSLAHDITDRVLAEEERRISREHLMRADKMASLGTLVAGVAHEINNPNQFIMANAQSIEKMWQSVGPVLTDAQAESGDPLLGGMTLAELSAALTQANQHIVEGARRIQRIVHELRDFARQGTSDRDEAVDVNDTVRAAVTLMGNMLRKSATSFTVEYDENAPRIRGNFQRIEQVVINLLQNACQALDGREGNIHVSIKGEVQPAVVSIAVTDQGAGMDAETLSQVTNPFFTTKRDTGGTGLGLSLSDTIVREHNGALIFESTVGVGTTATIRLPVVRPDAPLPGLQSAPAQSERKL